MVRRFAVPLVVVALVAASIAAVCGGETAAPPSSTAASPTPAYPLDPAQPGPYSVGVTVRRFERRSSTTGQPRILETYIWYPAAAAAAPDSTLKGSKDAPVATGGPFPLVLFSHGSGGNPLQSTYFTSRLASYGVVVAAPSHPGNTTADCFPCEDRNVMIDSGINRPADISAALDELLRLSAGGSDPLSGAVDGARVGASGHSFGAYTTLMVEPDGRRFRARLAMSAPDIVVMAGAIRSISVPTMIMSGDLDDVLPPAQQQSLFEKMGAVPRYLLTIHGAGHLSFSDVCIPAFAGCRPGDADVRAAHDVINRYGIAFLLTYVAGDDRYRGYLDGSRPVDAGVSLEAKN